MSPKLSNNYSSDLSSRVKSADLTVLMCDYDGVLVPASKGEEEAHMAKTAQELLEKILEIPSVKFGIITSRSPLDLEERIKLSGVHYFCNHGLEINGPDLRFVHSGAEKCREAIHNAAKTLRSQLRVERAIVDDRGLTAGLNYNLVMESQVSPMLAKARNLLANGIRERKIKIEEGRRTLEILPAVEWDRGMAAKMFYQTYEFMYPGKQILLIYVGYDPMDEPAFKYTLQVGVPMRVTQNKNTHALYYLKTQVEISRVLKIVKENAKKEAPEKPKEKMVL